MKVSLFKNIKWIYSPHLSVYLGIDNNLPSNDFADVVYAKLKIGTILPKHFHNRPHKSGYESFFFFWGGNIEILLADWKKQSLNTHEPFHLTFVDKEIHGIKNIGSTDLIFEVICAPKYQKNEEVIV